MMIHKLDAFNDALNSGSLVRGELSVSREGCVLASFVCVRELLQLGVGLCRSQRKGAYYFHFYIIKSLWKIGKLCVKVVEYY